MALNRPGDAVQDAAAASLSGVGGVANNADTGAGAAEMEGGNKLQEKLCPVVIVVGMAGSGKTTLVDAFSAYLEEDEEDDDDATSEGAQLAPGTSTQHSTANASGVSSSGTAAGSTSSAPVNGDAQLLPGSRCYVLNLDPAVAKLPYDPNVDIRDTVDYKRVMEEYTLGPNGAILTSLNLYATRFDQVLNLVEQRAKTHRAVVLDTPGQIETFTWSASGAIITESLAMAAPTVLLFVVDVPRAASAMTFVSSMLYACSIMYKSRLPMVVALNKADVGNAKIVDAWMRDFDAFDAALREESFVGELARSMAMALEQFYNVIHAVPVSAATGDGMHQLAKAVAAAAEEYERDYRPWLESKKAAARQREGQRQDAQFDAARADMRADRAEVANMRQHLAADMEVARRFSNLPLTDDVRQEIADELAEEERRKQEKADADPEEKAEFDRLSNYIDNLKIAQPKAGSSEAQQ